MAAFKLGKFLLFFLIVIWEVQADYIIRNVATQLFLYSGTTYVEGKPYDDWYHSNQTWDLLCASSGTVQIYKITSSSMNNGLAIEGGSILHGRIIIEEISGDLMPNETWYINSDRTIVSAGTDEGNTLALYMDDDGYVTVEVPDGSDNQKFDII